jgi:hypothetical protein
VAAATCSVCKRFLRVFKPAADAELERPDKFPMHRYTPGAGRICPGSGRSVPLYAKRDEQ